MDAARRLAKHSRRAAGVPMSALRPGRGQLLGLGLIDAGLAAVMGAMREVPPLVEMSLDAPLESRSQRGDYSPVTMAELLPDERPPAGLGVLLGEMLDELHKLPVKERIVVALRFGISLNPMTLEEIGELLGVSRERVRQIEVKTLETMHGKLEQRCAARSGADVGSGDEHGHRKCVRVSEWAD